MHHTIAYNSSLAASTDAQITAVTDGILAIQNNNFILQEPHMLLYAAAMSADLQRVRIITPKVRQITTPFIQPIASAAIPGTEPRVADYRENPFLLREREEIQVNGFQSNVAAQEVTAILGLDWGAIPASRGDIYTMRGTATTAAVADAWTQILVTWQDSIPVGRYAIVGFRHFSANGRAARLIVENQYPRPGGLSMTTIGARPHDMFMRGGLGIWGYFNSVRMPNVEVFANAADAVHECYLDFVPTF